MVEMPRSARPAAMRSPMRLTNLTGVESESGTELMVAVTVVREGGRGRWQGRFCETLGWRPRRRVGA